MGADTPRQLQQSGRLAILRAYNAPEAPQTAKNDNSGHLCARTKNRPKKATVKPETVKGKYSQSGTETETSQTETGTETSREETEQHPDRAGDRQRVLHSFHIAGDRDRATMYGSEPPRECKSPARP